MKFVVILIALLVVSACSSSPSAKAVLSPLGASGVQGEIFFEQVGGGVRIFGEVKWLKPGLHGFHIHEFGNCSANDGSSAGAHFDTFGAQHASPDMSIRHAGDLGNLEAKEDGTARYDRTNSMFSLKEKNSVLGKSVIVHADEDDFRSQPAGNSGARIACGVIALS